MIPNTILEGDVLHCLKELPSDSIDCVMTSPPYWALRDYKIEGTIWDSKAGCEHNFEIIRTERPNSSGGKGNMQDGNEGSFSVDYTDRGTYSSFCKICNAWKGQLGLEPTFDLFIKHLCNVFDEVKRVLKKTGTCWVNLGDTYASTPSGLSNKKAEEWNNKGDGLFNRLHRLHTNDMTSETTYKPTKYEGVVEKSLCLIPFRFAIEMQNRGWILRNVIIWHKPNCMPSSIKDRFTVDFEYVFFFVKNKKYYFETQYETAKVGYNDMEFRPLSQKDLNDTTKMCASTSASMNRENKFIQSRNKRAVWKITTKPFPESHFAVYPEELCETPIKAGCPEFICNKCGMIREKIYEQEGYIQTRHRGASPKSYEYQKQQGLSDTSSLITGMKKNLISKGLSNCNCNAGFHTGIVLDPFFGAGTTGLVALKQNRKFIGIEINPKYVKIAKRRLKPYLEQEKLI